ncbi:glucosamine-6-phosphate deaminase [Sporosarcina pasteurii]|uniref:Glucosamine-6-phosphate deaminase n=1 Tax=Sporosarcina pasteurii TaxID=1474 RepID=A0A380BEM2_SPOPA|nr:glucosamine-6-phosphate deaminase [Sporosarcina pasteurii]MDS9470293.1 glucosamine-6-phosphate deaminase [Sporosarcina pasteurii]QBQ05992.1 glucosamine-6-phosphate deaminase [Sporosarcina pasteurii]SUI99721.1 Glucosamine-6-phosphate deaminase [Sporosarcina pasteurii]
MNGLKFIKVNNPDEGSENLFNIIKEALEKNELHVLGLATGGTMIPVYKKWVESDLDFSGVTTFNLDEYVGISDDNPNGYAYFMNEHLFSKKKFKKVNTLNGLAENLEEECQRFEDLLLANPLDIQILGVGENGHIAFNEPGTPFDSVTHVAKLTQSTLEVNSRFFKPGEKVPNTAMTMGIKSILRAKKIVLLAFGEKKRAALTKLSEGKVDSEWPITKLLEHDNVTIITDLAI